MNEQDTVDMDAVSYPIIEAVRSRDGLLVEIVDPENNPHNPRRPLPHIVRHSPTGMEMGYMGSGPADLALSVLTAVVGPGVAERTYQAFKVAFIAPIEGDRWTASFEAVETWARKQING